MVDWGVKDQIKQKKNQPLYILVVLFRCPHKTLLKPQKQEAWQVSMTRFYSSGKTLYAVCTLMDP